MPAQSGKKGQVVSVEDLDTVRHEDFRFLHANRARISENFFDVTLVFGSIVPPAQLKGDLPYVEERVGVTMSWEHLRALRDVLNERLEHYESQIGPVRDHATAGKSTKPAPKK